MKPIVLIASVARNGVIGNGNELAWREREDQRWFRQQTIGCPVIMGRRTWDSLPPAYKPLPDRNNIVVTRQQGWTEPGVITMHDIASALQYAQLSAVTIDAHSIFVIGGAQLYTQALPLADKLIITEIELDILGDVLFPSWPRAQYTRIASQPHHSFVYNCGYSFVTYIRKS
jgi:dihydrofolate reductase